MDDYRYQLDMLTAMNKTYAANEKIYKLICEVSNRVFVYFNAETGLLRSYGHWNDYFNFTLNDYSDLTRILDIFTDECRDEVRNLFYLEQKGKSEGRCIATLKENGKYVEVTGNVIYNSEDKVHEKLFSLSDVNTREKLKNDLTYMAYYDLMTNLYNRNYFIQKLSEFLVKAELEKTVVSVMMINIDDFHKINDSLGIIYGDEVIQDFGLFLQTFTDSEAVIGSRFDGDIYSLAIYDPAGSKSVDAIYSKIKERLEEPFLLTNGSQITFTVSIGVAEYPESGTKALELCNGAEIVMLKVKENGKNNISYFDSLVLQKFIENINFEKNLKEAVRETDFTLNFQPQYFSNSEQLRGVEALIRWRDKEGNNISPSVFINVAERIGEIVSIGDWVLDKAISTYMDWKKKYDIEMTMSVNVSPLQYKQPDFVSKVINTINKYNMNPNNLELEITESVLISDMSAVFEKMEELRDFGVKISIDDFGTGYSSLSYLNKLPADTVKIDKSFIDSVENDEATRVIVGSVVEMAKKLGFETVAEGVENSSQLNFLKEHDCELIQGYLLGKPLTQEQMEDLLLRMI